MQAHPNRASISLSPEPSRIVVVTQNKGARKFDSDDLGIIDSAFN